MRRREFILVPAKALSGLVLSSLLGEFVPAAAQDSVKVPLRFFTAAEAKIVQAACERIFPSDENGPGASEAGVIIYIDRQLAGPYGRDKYRYTKPPWIESVPEHGYQGKENPQQIYRAGIALLGSGFAELAPAEQDAKLASIERTMFFQMLRTHTIEGMFCDPLHGGNAGMIGWQLIGFPGPRMSYAGEVDKYYGRESRPEPLSLAQVLGRNVKPGEEAK